MVTAYHFLQANMRAGEGDEPPWEIGESRTIANPAFISLCSYGYHSSPSLWDALHYAPGPVACLVEVSEPTKRDDSKQVSISRKLIKAVNVERELRLFACDCAERVLYLFERERPADSRPRDAINIARAFANGSATHAELDAAWAAAGDAAWAAAWDAARAAETKWQREHFDRIFGEIFD